MRKIDVIKLMNSGIIEMTAHELSPAHYYKAFKLKKEVEKAYNAIDEEQKAIYKEQGITDELKDEIVGLVEKAQEGKEVSAAEREKVKDYNRRMKKAKDIIEEAAKEDVTIDIKTIPFLEWRRLQAENRAKKIGDKEVNILGGIAEVILYGVFWRDPETDEIAEEPKGKKSKGN